VLTQLAVEFALKISRLFEMKSINECIHGIFGTSGGILQFFDLHFIFYASHQPRSLKCLFLS
jgi:hypothetical protein